MAEIFYSIKKVTRLKSGASASLMICVVLVLTAENFLAMSMAMANVRAGKDFPTILLKLSVLANGKLLLAITLANMISVAVTLSTLVPAVTYRHPNGTEQEPSCYGSPAL